MDGRRDVALGSILQLLVAMATSNQNPATPAPTAATENGEVHAPDIHHNIGTGYSRVEFLRFGGEDFKGWLYRCEQFFEYDGTSEKMKTEIAVINLEGRALQWLKSQLGRALF